MTVTRENTEIFDQAHLMHAEGTSDEQPLEEDIKLLLSKEHWHAYAVDIWHDTMQGFWRWDCKIKKL